MELVFIHGPGAAGKLTIARALAARTGYSLFHNHLIVDAVAAVFPFGTPEFARLREQFWLDMFRAAASASQSLIFTFAPEPTVALSFPERVVELIEAAGGRVVFVALTLDVGEQERRLVNVDRAAFGKLRSIEILRQFQDEFKRCEKAMPAAALTIDTGQTQPEDAADKIMKLLFA
ncbi:shikimate kinase [Sphingosinicella rhizophila]|uniref:Shikimate kinase n=1 Tax=Sphingosinicella rhizophila TaxID=3050082 RepID=A0ABU3Q9Y7_9SPHN|nr:shikimate kinase [Sphingosinicella sp. GR2756]MDT9600228.1 shikimate kinase [Sphingosinicella sp. GR2756]